MYILSVIVILFNQMRNKLTLFISVLILSLSFISSGFILQNKGKVFADARDDLNSYCEQNHSRSLPNGSDAEIICRIGDPQDILRDDRVGELWNALSEEQKSTARNEDHCEQIYDDQSIIDSCKDLVNEQTGAAEVQDANCENRSAAMGWIMCPLIYATDEALEWIDNSIESLLEVDRNRYDNPEMRDAWANIRNIAYLILVPIALVMVISTALGFEFISAYTVKRALPRLGAAVIFIALSYQITILLIDISNGIGFSTKGLLQAPFNMGGDINLQTLFGGSPLTSIVSLPVAAVGVVLIAWLFGGTLLLFAGSAFLVLMFRQILIVALMLVAPLAILAWIFPGNDKLWKTWWGTFSKLLMMFPLIMAVISVGHIFAWILDRPNEGGVAGVLQPLMILAAYLLPYAAIPFTFKFAGGMFATISGIANDRSKGLFDRQRKKRAEKLERAKHGNMFKGGTSSNFRGRLNRGAAGAMMLNQAGINPRHMRTRLRTALNDASENDVEDAMKHESFTPWSGDDAKVWASRYETHDQIAAELERQDAGRFAGEANRARREEAVAQIMRSQKEIGHETFHKARVRAQAKTGTGYQYTDENGQTQVDYSRMVDDINSAYGNDRNGAGKALAEMRGALAQSGQIGGMAGYGTWAQAMEDRYHGRITEEAAHNMITDDAIDSVSPSQALYGKPSSAAALASAHRRRIQAISAGIQNGTHNMNDLSAAVSAAAGLYDAMGQASPGNASAFANELMSADIGLPEISIPNASGGSTTLNPGGTVREYIEMQMAGNDEFRNRRRDLASSTLAQAAHQEALIRAAAPTPTQGGTPGSTPPGMPPNPLG